MQPLPDGKMSFNGFCSSAGQCLGFNARQRQQAGGRAFHVPGARSLACALLHGPPTLLLPAPRISLIPTTDLHDWMGAGLQGPLALTPRS